MSPRRKLEPFDHHRGKMPLLRPMSPLRTGIHLGINFLVFVAVNAFLLYLSSGRWVNFSPAAYYRDLTTPMGHMLLYPINVVTHPWMILVTGLLLAVVIFIPIIVSVLYRLVFAMLFVAVVALLGHAPLLALTLTIGCILASRTRLRSDLPFLAFLLGLLPQGLYLFLFSFAGFEGAPGPLDQLILKAPLLIAIVASIVAAVIVLALARALKYRPGVVWPVLAVLLAAPMLIFFLNVGSDELEYELIASSLQRNDELLEVVPLETWKLQNQAQGLSERTLQARVKDDLEANRRPELLACCDRFLDHRPNSRQAPAVLWVRAQAVSLQFDPPCLDEGVVRYSAAYPHSDSAASWQRLLDNYATTPQAALARWRLGELALRDGQIPEGIDHLRRSAQQITTLLEKRKGFRATDNPKSVSGARVMPERGYYENALWEVQRLLWILDRADVPNDPPSAEALQAYLRLDPFAADYLQRLSELVAIYGPTRLGDHLRLFLAMATPDEPLRVDLLKQLADDPHSDAAPGANYELGISAMHARRPATTAPATGTAPATSPALKAPQDYFAAVIAASPNPWTKWANDRMNQFAKPKPPKDEE